MDLYRKSVRIRLCFEERGMLSKAQVDQGLAKCWYLVNADVLSVGHLAARIDHDYRLGGSCPQGLVLEMCGFVLPPAQSTRILQDSDIVSVRRKRDGASRGQSRELLTNSLSVDNEEADHAYRVGRGGLRALDEFEKEAGGYQGELSEDEVAELSLSSGKKAQAAMDARKKLRVKESSGKKRKRAVHIDAQIQTELMVSTPKPRKSLEGLVSEPSELKKQKSSRKKNQKKPVLVDHGSSQLLALEFNTLEDTPASDHMNGGVSAKTEKQKKKKKTPRELKEPNGSDPNSADISFPKEAIAQETRPGKGRKVKSVNETADLEQPAGIESGSQKLTPDSSRGEKKSRKRQDINHDDHEVELLKDKKSKSSEKGVMLHEAQLQPSITKEHVADRTFEQAKSAEKVGLLYFSYAQQECTKEKAKKRWLREQALNGVVPKNDDDKSQQTEQTEQQANTSRSGTSEDNAKTEAEVEAEVEAEEEIVPRMVAPGHIRYDHGEDASDEGLCATSVLLSYTEVRCKKQGQAWGQEKFQGNSHSEDGHYRRSGEMENRASEVMVDQLPSARVDFENLSLLNRAPGVGDLLAYRLVELTASWTPELSSYRVGKVSLYDGISKVVTMLPVPEYPLHVQQPEDCDEDEQTDENVFLPPYYPDGTLEVNLATLMEVRVLEEGLGGRLTASQANPDAPESLDVNATTVDIPNKSLQPATLSSKVPQDHVDSVACVNLNATSSDVNPQSNLIEVRTGGDIEAGQVPSSTTELEPILDQPTGAGWHDMLSEEINRKKLELSLKAGNDLEGQKCVNVQDLAPTDSAINLGNQGARAQDGRKNIRVNGAPIIRHRYMRTGALGPTMALLRANQVL